MWGGCGFSCGWSYGRGCGHGWNDGWVIDGDAGVAVWSSHIGGVTGTGSAAGAVGIGCPYGIEYDAGCDIGCIGAGA